MLNIPKQYSSLEYVGEITWKDIFDEWRKAEAWQECWKKHWEERGFNSYDEWRTAYSAPLKPDSLNWFMYEVTDPVKDFPYVYGVPSRAWIDKAYKGEKTKQLKDIISDPIIANNDKAKEIKENFPRETMLTALLWQNKIVLIEGMHRACALADWGKEPFSKKVKIALAEMKGDLPSIGGDYKNK